MKDNVWLSQPNHSYGKNCFLPYSAGMLQAYAQSKSEIREAYEFQPIIFKREEISKVLARMYANPPSVLGLSCYIWNFEYNMALAKAARANFGCVIVAGGPHIPVDSGAFFAAHPEVDVAINYEGERAFAEILRKLIDGGVVTKDAIKGQRIEHLDELPSPYLTGVFDSLMGENPDVDFHASQETHRGCPYSCTFCDWGSAVLSKVRRFSQDRIYSELRWMTSRKIDLIYNCDANYGLFPADIEITKAMAGLKAEHGYPRKFRAAYAKNSNDNIFEHAKILHEAGMNKGVTLSFQSMDPETLKIVKRDNIKVQEFERLMGKYRKAGIATYSELILGLPGETYNSFARGLDTLIECGQHDSLQIYACEVLPNSEMNDPEYKREHGVSTVRSPIPMFHGTPSDDPHQEYYEIVTQTSTMPETDWMRSQMLAWAVQAFHCLGLTQAIAIAFHRLAGVPYHKFYERMLVRQDNSIGKIMKAASLSFTQLREGKPWGEYNPLFGDVTWPPEEAAFLRCVYHKREFYDDLKFTMEGMTKLDPELLEELWVYQESVVAEPEGVSFKLATRYDWKAFVDGGPLEKSKGWYQVEPAIDCEGDLEKFAREVVWYGRKGGSFKNRVEYI